MKVRKTVNVAILALADPGEQGGAVSRYLDNAQDGERFVVNGNSDSVKWTSIGEIVAYRNN